ncbi:MULTISPECIES: DsbA family protein [Staphylococcus]|uniref:DsbA family protein n=1 Tax=Staphylococcus TaxID=1279 RepID=UPI0021D08597|nr:DsbA family protein [Staphylococcus sp. IVB6181]UXV35504.1 DsbA family protein [Staphylococcus sp. IVB6181]
MKKWFILISIILLAVIVQGCSQKDPELEGKGSKIKIIEFADYKCPYCKKVDNQIMPKLQKEYIDKGKAEYQMVNLAFLGKDSIIGSRAGHAVQIYAPKQYLAFQHKIFNQQPDTKDHKKPWINEKLLDSLIDELDISDETKAKIKKDYKTKDSKSYKAAKQDQKFAKEKKIDTVPVVYIDGQVVKDPYHIKDYKTLLDEK